MTALGDAVSGWTVLRGAEGMGFSRIVFSAVCLFITLVSAGAFIEGAYEPGSPPVRRAGTAPGRR
ncbi:hypothetical protein I6A60_30980 [Frankia sp. AgB1.9]|uniref:hypothetical protein n=1 Tax=unclassified Frankia TaxID=2632575 RepID=UPI001933D96A|nr:MULTISPECIES: hypothetical protein [unclassified Frankia]MBL7490790.1 hypothetical protein [Frankia sp. AgW1.1]MBL7552254.1 hypothetical protein [Frankia sp. AgB1.9]MBL7621988.1 hypothetical protein [Frankia sp. AgB1.8]